MELPAAEQMSFNFIKAFLYCIFVVFIYGFAYINVTTTIEDLTRDLVCNFDKYYILWVRLSFSFFS